ncbi:MAG: hypothetical protein OXN90_11115 [Gemmatimonadota bacterium]|nr:hypothetical protein [Gemmatimonadota bacterium]
MIRVELLGRQRRWSPWSKALLSALVVCGGLYGIHLFFPALAGSLFSADSALSPAAQQDQEAASSPVAQQESTPEPTAQQETAPSPVQEAASSPVGQQEKTPKSVAQRDTVPSSVAQQETAPSLLVQQESTKPVAEQETIPSPGMQQETTPSPVQEIEPKPATRQEVALGSAAQQDTLPSPVAQQETASSPVQEALPNPVREIESKPVVQPEATPSSSTRSPTPSQAPSPQRSTACHQVMRIDEQVPAGIRVASLNCNSSGEYWLEGTSPSHKVLREFRLSLKALPSRVSFSTWREERTLRFAFQGHFADQDTPPLDALSSDQAEQFFGKVARWADASGLDSLSIHKPIHWPLSPTRSHQRQKLRGIGSPQQIDAFLQQLQQAEAVATLGEVLLLPVKSDEHGWVQARLYAAVDIIVDGP